MIWSMLVWPPWWVVSNPPRPQFCQQHSQGLEIFSHHHSPFLPYQISSPCRELPPALRHRFRLSYLGSEHEVRMRQGDWIRHGGIEVIAIVLLTFRTSFDGDILQRGVSPVP